MKALSLLTALLLATAVFAKPREWKEATFLGMTSQTNGAVAMPIGNMVVAAPINGRTYWVECEGIVYALQTNYTGHWPSLTVHGKTKFALDGRSAHILDEEGKDRKFSIVEKIAK